MQLIEFQFPKIHLNVFFVLNILKKFKMKSINQDKLNEGKRKEIPINFKSSKFFSQSKKKLKFHIFQHFECKKRYLQVFELDLI